MNVWETDSVSARQNTVESNWAFFRNKILFLFCGPVILFTLSQNSTCS